MSPPPHTSYITAIGGGEGGGKTTTSYQPSLSPNTPPPFMLGHVINSQAAMMHRMCSVHASVGKFRYSSGL
jgi:hypothetical protein